MFDLMQYALIFYDFQLILAQMGFEPQSLDRLFDAFYTTKPEGMGLGLAISRRIIEAHGGRLWATVNPGRGATFHFTLPTEPEAHK